MTSEVSLDLRGSVFNRLSRVGYDTGALRPWKGRKDQTYASLLTGKYDSNGDPIRKVFAVNAETTMTRDAWLLFDNEVIEAAKAKLMFWQKLRSINTLTIPDGMAVTKLEQQRRSDITDATISMDARRRGEADIPQYDDISLPLPIIHKDADFSLRDLAVSRRGGAPLDTTNLRLTGEKVALAVEELSLGIRPIYRYGGSAVYGATNFPNRLTHTLLVPTDGAWTPEKLRQQIVEAIKLLIENFHYGPFDIVYGLNWYEHMQKPFSAQYDSELLIDRLRSLDMVSSVEMSALLTGYQMVIVERNPMTARAVVGMDIRTVEWETGGGMEKHLKTMCIMVAQYRSDYYEQTGILHLDVA